MTTATTTNFKAGDRVRVIADNSSHKFPVGTVVTLLRPDYEGASEWLATTDPEVTKWSSAFDGETVCRYVSITQDIEPAFKVGDRVKGEGIWSGKTREGVVVEVVSDRLRIQEGESAHNYIKTETAEQVEEEPVVITPQVGDLVTGRGGSGQTFTGTLLAEGFPLERDNERTIETEDERQFYILRDTMELVAASESTPTLAEVMELTKAFRNAEQDHSRHETDVDYYQELVDAATSRLEDAAAKREEAFAALQAALIAYNG